MPYVVAQWAGRLLKRLRGVTPADLRPREGSTGSWDFRRKAWTALANARRRCADSSRADYGGRGIRVEYRSFEHFLDDVGLPPSLAHTLDRIDNDGNYAPGNCRWATWSEQHHNSRHAVWLTCNGRRMLQREWAAELGIHESTLSLFLKAGGTIEQACERYWKSSRGIVRKE